MNGLEVTAATYHRVCDLQDHEPTMDMDTLVSLMADAYETLVTSGGHDLRSRGRAFLHHRASRLGREYAEREQ